MSSSFFAGDMSCSWERWSIGLTSASLDTVNDVILDDDSLASATAAAATASSADDFVAVKTVWSKDSWSAIPLPLVCGGLDFVSCFGGAGSFTLFSIAAANVFVRSDDSVFGSESCCGSFAVPYRCGNVCS